MQRISVTERDAILKVFPDAHIKHTRHRYYLTLCHQQEQRRYMSCTHMTLTPKAIQTLRDAMNK